MSNNVTSNMVCCGWYAERVKQVYDIAGNNPFTYQQIKKEIDDFKQSYLKAMHESKVIRLNNNKYKENSSTPKNPAVWVFTAEALFFIKKHNK